MHPRNFLSMLLQHYRALFVAVDDFIRAPLSHLMTICVIAIAIALPLSLFVLLQNLGLLNDKWHASTPTISLYVNPSATKAQLDQLTRALHDNKNIADITFIPAKTGLEILQKKLLLNNTLEQLRDNPLPSVFVVLPTISNQKPLLITELFNTLKQLPNIDLAQIDLNWVKRLYDTVRVGNRIVSALGVLFGFGILLIIGNTLRMTLLKHTQEVQLLKLMGATNGFIRRPLLYRGVLYGLLGGLLAWMLAAVFIWQLQSPVSTLAQTYQTHFHLEGLDWRAGWRLICLTGLLGFAGAWFMTTRFLNAPENA